MKIHFFESFDYLQMSPNNGNVKDGHTCNDLIPLSVMTTCRGWDSAASLKRAYVLRQPTTPKH